MVSEISSVHSLSFTHSEHVVLQVWTSDLYCSMPKLLQPPISSGGLDGNALSHRQLPRQHSPNGGLHSGWRGHRRTPCPMMPSGGPLLSGTPPPVECTVACVCYPISHECVWSQLQAMFVSHTEPNAINVSAHGAIPEPGRGTGSERSPRVAAGTCQQPVSSILNSLPKPCEWKILVRHLLIWVHIHCDVY